jgi:hypothetical protein
MTNKVLLNNVDHHDLRVTMRHGSEFGDSVNQVLIFPTEFEAVQREYPILFKKGDDGGIQAVALLGLDRDENLFLADNGRWQARYVPAMQQRGPFSIALQRAGAGEDRDAVPMINVDLDDPRIGRDEGQRLFLPQGGNSPILEHVADVLRTIHMGLELSGPMYAMFEDLGLLDPVVIEIKLSDVEEYKLPNHMTVSQERFVQLDAAGLGKLHRAGFLQPAVLAMASLANMSRLIELKNLKRAGM